MFNDSVNDPLSFPIILSLRIESCSCQYSSLNGDSWIGLIGDAADVTSGISAEVTSGLSSFKRFLEALRLRA